jgi:hypothetical protein
MTYTNKRASLNFYEGANGPTLMFLMHEDADLFRLQAIFKRLAQNEATKVSLRTEGIVQIVGPIDDLVFARLSTKQEPSRMVRKIQDTPRGPLFEFRRYEEGWLECSELIDGLTGPGHQYLSRGSSDEAMVMVSYKEHLRDG